MTGEGWAGVGGGTMEQMALFLQVIPSNELRRINVASESKGWF